MTFETQTARRGKAPVRNGDQYQMLKLTPCVACFQQVIGCTDGHNAEQSAYEAASGVIESCSDDTAFV